MKYQYLRVTNITDTPINYITDRIESACEELEIPCTDEIVTAVFEWIDNEADYVSLPFAQEFVDNLLINHDFTKTVKDLEAQK